MRPLLILMALLALAAPAGAADPLTEARRLYNLGQYDDAERMLREIARGAAGRDGARVILGRIQLERYRRSADPAHLEAARTALRTADVRSLDPREKMELTIGLAEALFFENRFGAAAEMFEMVMDAAPLLGPAAHERVVDWWATALEKLARQRPAAERAVLFDRIAARMTSEITADPGSTSAGYWLVAAARGRGDLEKAADLAAAGWVRALLARDRGVLLRADIDRLMVEAIIPERASRINPRDAKASQAGLTAEWDAFKEKWSR
jgi:hypothetical protein